MIRSRFLALSARGRDLDPVRLAAFERFAADERLAIHRLNPACCIAADGSSTTIVDGAALVGRCLEADGEPAPGRVREHLARRSELSQVTACIWGDYVLIRTEPDGHGIEVLRSPVGDLPCYWTEAGNVTLIASHIDLLQKAGFGRARVAWSECARFLLATELRREATCLEGIYDLPGGQSLRIASGVIERRTIWSPWQFGDREQQVESVEEGAALVRRAVLAAVAGRAPPAQRSVLLLSGGLDSSVVGASLASNGSDFTCLNMVARDRSGDERVHARIVAESIGRTLAEHERDVAEIDLERSEAAGRPRPSASVFRQSTEKAARDQARVHDADLIVDGGGGDNLFCSLQSVAPAIDRLLVAGPGPGFVSTCREIATLAHASMWTVGRRTLQRLLSRRVRYGWTVDRSFLTASALQMLPSTLEHPWLDHPPGALPGTAAHVGLVLAASNLAGAAQNDPGPVFCSPLVSQPVLEAVLRVPTWMWFHDGRNRVVARKAFAVDLPEATVHRRSKGTPAGFMAELVEQRREAIRSLLLDGLLVQHGVVDRSAVEGYLSLAAPARDFGFARVLQLVDVEAWARSWA